MNQLQEEIIKLKRQVWRLRKADWRKSQAVGIPEQSPKSSKKLCQTQTIASPMRRQLFQGYASKAQLKSTLNHFPPIKRNKSSQE